MSPAAAWRAWLAPRAAGRWVAGTTTGRAAFSAGVKNSPLAVTPNATTIRWARVSRSDAAASTSVANRTAPTPSLASMTARRGQRSTSAPAGRLSSHCARPAAVPTRPAWIVEPVICSATSGKTNMPIETPTPDTV